MVSQPFRLFDAAANNQIGGTNPDDGNIIAWNSGIAVALEGDAGTGNAILGNSIYENVSASTYTPGWFPNTT
jgi:hypothetical protein